MRIKAIPALVRGCEGLGGRKRALFFISYCYFFPFEMLHPKNLALQATTAVLPPMLCYCLKGNSELWLQYT